MILGQDEHETDAKIRTLMNSASELTNSLEMVKKHVSLWNHSILMSEIGVRRAKMRRKQTRKIGFQRIQL